MFKKWRIQRLILKREKVLNKENNCHRLSYMTKYYIKYKLFREKRFYIDYKIKKLLLDYMGSNTTASTKALVVQENNYKEDYEDLSNSLLCGRGDLYFTF